MKIKMLSFLVVVLALVSCEKPQKPLQQQEKNMNAEIIVDTIDYMDSIQINPKVTAVYASQLLYFPEITNQNILDSIYFDYPSDLYNKDVLLLKIQDSAKAYFERNKDYPERDFKINLTQKSRMEALYHEKEFLAIKYFTFWDQGGAHPNSNGIYKVFDLRNNRKLALSDITELDSDQLSDLLMTNFKNTEQYKSQGENANISEMLLVDKISPNENFYFDENNLYFHYNPYEIAPYAMGNIDISIPWEKIKNSLNPEFKERMEF